MSREKTKNVLKIFSRRFFVYLFAVALASITARANWSAQEVGLPPQVFPFRYCSIFSGLHPSTSFEMALRLPLQPPSKLMFLTLSSSKSKVIFLEQVPKVLYSYFILFTHFNNGLSSVRTKWFCFLQNCFAPEKEKNSWIFRCGGRRKADALQGQQAVKRPNLAFYQAFCPYQ